MSTFAGSSWRGIFGPMGESSSLFLPPAIWEELGGLDKVMGLRSYPYTPAPGEAPRFA